jgi:hypothetical protein
MAFASPSETLSLSNVGIDGGGFLISLMMFESGFIPAPFGWHPAQCLLNRKAPFTSRADAPWTASVKKAKNKMKLRGNNLFIEVSFRIIRRSYYQIRFGNEIFLPRFGRQLTPKAYRVAVVHVLARSRERLLRRMRLI